jgi:hypothetical protein
MSFNWPTVWAFLWPILREALIAFLVALLTLLGYDRQVLPSRILGGLKKMGFKVERGDAYRGKHG